MPIDKKSKLWIGPSASDQYLSNKSDVAQVSAIMSKSVSEERRALLAREVDRGLFKDGSGPSYNEDGSTPNGRVVSSMSKFGQAMGSNSGYGGTVKQIGEVYSPLWLNSNLSLPRDRATINAWCRSFFALNPFVHNAINLHSTYPISKLNIKCPNKDIENFFNDMIEEIDLMNICVQIAQEYWLLGESFVYAELDESKGKWSRLMIQNPDYMIVKRTVVADEPIIMLKPDENLKKIIFSNRASDIEQRKQLNNHIIDSVKRGENIPLDNFNVSHLANRISPYEIRGTGLPVCIFRQLMLFDRLRECYSEDTEVLTDKGFKKINELVNYSNDIKIETEINYDLKIACVNNNDEIEYHDPNGINKFQYDGKMLHFLGKKIDCLVDPDHQMIAKTSDKFNKIKAKDFSNKKIFYKLKSKAKYVTGKTIDFVEICGKKVPINLYLKVLGYITSEGCIYENFENGRYDAKLYLCQLTSSDCYHDMRESFQDFAKIFGKKSNNTIHMSGTGFALNKPKEKWEARIHGKKLTKFFKNEIGVENNTISINKHLPRWIIDLEPKLLEIVLDALVKGDGSEYCSNYETKSKHFRYSTISKQLADDVYEIVYKCGFVPTIFTSNKFSENDRYLTEYIVLWSDTNYGNEPIVNTFNVNTGNGGGARIKEIDYKGEVWSYNSPTNSFITRRNGKLTIQGDGLFDKETEILTNQGFKNISHFIKIKPDNFINGLELDKDGKITSTLTLKKDVKIACYNLNNEIEYHAPVELHISKYVGEMINFKAHNTDVLVSPNHKMWAKNYTSNHFEKIKANEINTNYIFKGFFNKKNKYNEYLEPIKEIKKINYDGIVWCFEVPTGLFITRRNGKITVQGNSKFAQADNMVNPLTLIKIGGEGQDALHPTFADLEHWRSVFECYDEETEILTKDGFKKFNQVISYKEEDGIISEIKPIENLEIACFNSQNEQLEYHKPLNASLYNYNGEMYHFANTKMDIKVTPNHKMYISKKEYEYHGHRSLRKSYWGDFKKIEAKDIDLLKCHKFRSQLSWIGNDNVTNISVCGKNVPIELYLEFMGYLISEGCLYKNTNSNRKTTEICQSFNKYKDTMELCFNNFAHAIDKKYSVRITKNSKKHSDMWAAVFRSDEIYDHFKDAIGDDDGQTKAPFKRIPRWIMELSPRLLKILLHALVLGDGSIKKNKNNTTAFSYYTTSKQLCDDVFEIVYKCGYVPTFFTRDKDNYINKNKRIRLPLYNINWSENNNGRYPLINDSYTTKEMYQGKVWCFQVPTGLFVTRRNGKITIQGNSAENDKDFKIFTHPGVTVERVGYGQGIYDISGDITQLIKEIYVGLQVPSVLCDGGADTTYANGGVALDVLRQRYMQFRNMIAIWLKRKIFAPISKIQGFYDYSGGEKRLIVPEIDWNHMSLFDAGDYIQGLLTLTQGDENAKRASLHTLYRSLGLEYEDEIRKMRKESIQQAIALKEKAALEAMDLVSLRALDEDDEIPEPEKAPQGGPNPAPEAPLPGEAGSPSPPPGLDLGIMPPPPSPPPGGNEAPPAPPAPPEIPAK